MFLNMIFTYFPIMNNPGKFKEILLTGFYFKIEVNTSLTQNKKKHKGGYTYDVHQNCLIFKTPPLVHTRPKFFHPLDLGQPILNNPPPNLSKNKTKLCHIHIDHGFYYSI